MSPQPDVSIVHLDGFLTVVDDAVGIPAHSGGLSPAGTPAPNRQIFFGDEFDTPAWMNGAPLELPSPVSTGPESVFEQPTAPTTIPLTLPAPVRPTLADKDLVMIALSTFGLNQLQLIVPAIVAGCETPLTLDEVSDRLQLLWLMRREMANQIRNTILLGLTRREPAGVVLSELLKLANHYTEDPQ